MSEKKQSLTVRFPVDLLERIRAKAKEMDRSLGYTIRKLLEERLASK